MQSNKITKYNNKSYNFNIYKLRGVVAVVVILEMEIAH